MLVVLVLDNGNQSRTGTPHAIEKGNHLRHGRHLHFFCHHRTYDCTDDEPEKYKTVI